MKKQLLFGVMAIVDALIVWGVLRLVGVKANPVWVAVGVCALYCAVQVYAGKRSNPS